MASCNIQIASGQLMSVQHYWAPPKKQSSLRGMRPPGPHHIFRTDCALHLAPHLPCRVCNQGKKGKPQNLASRGVGGFKALERGRPMTFAENGRRKLGNWNFAAQTTEGLQKDTKSRPALLLFHSMFALCVYLPVSPICLRFCPHA